MPFGVSTSEFGSSVKYGAAAASAATLYKLLEYAVDRRLGKLRLMVDTEYLYKHVLLNSHIYDLEQSASTCPAGLVMYKRLIRHADRMCAAYHAIMSPECEEPSEKVLKMVYSYANLVFKYILAMKRVKGMEPKHGASIHIVYEAIFPIIDEMTSECMQKCWKAGTVTRTDYERCTSDDK